MKWYHVLNYFYKAYCKVFSFVGHLIRNHSREQNFVAAINAVNEIFLHQNNRKSYFELMDFYFLLLVDLSKWETNEETNTLLLKTYVNTRHFWSMMSNDILNRNLYTLRNDMTKIAITYFDWFLNCDRNLIHIDIQLIL